MFQSTYFTKLTTTFVKNFGHTWKHVYKSSNVKPFEPFFSKECLSPVFILFGQVVMVDWQWFLMVHVCLQNNGRVSYIQISMLDKYGFLEWPATLR